MKKITLGVCGSSAVWKACALIDRLQEQDATIDIQVLLSEGARKFIHPFLFQTMTKHAVPRNEVEEGKSEQIAHLQIAQNTDCFVLCPATANTIAKTANGVADNLLNATLFALPPEVPVLFAPAMNEKMYLNPTTQKNITALKERGFLEIPPREGLLSSGDVALGTLAKIEDIEREILAVLGK